MEESDFTAASWFSQDCQLTWNRDQVSDKTNRTLVDASLLCAISVTRFWALINNNFRPFQCRPGGPPLPPPPPPSPLGTPLMMTPDEDGKAMEGQLWMSCDARLFVKCCALCLCVCVWVCHSCSVFHHAFSFYWFCLYFSLTDGKSNQNGNLC